jgi:amino acid adenylation domain-containing protein
VARVSESPSLDYGGPIDRPFEAFPESALDASIVDRFETIVQRFPNRLAIRGPSSSLTYRELEALVARIGAATASVMGNRTGPIGIFLDRDARYPAAMLGVLSAGGAYAALDANHPVERNRVIAEQAGIRAIVSAGAAAEQAATLLPSPVPIIDIDTLVDLPIPRSAIRPAATDLGYIYFTSGSEGIPKGVPHSHRNMLHMILQYTNALHLGPEDQLTLVYPPSNAAASRDIFAALLNGASLHFLSPADLQPDGLVREIQTRGITIYHSTPSLLRRLAEVLGANERLESVRIASLGGDRVEWRDIDLCRRVFSLDVHMYMALTSTESHLRCHWFIDNALRHTTPRPPVGRPLPDRTLSIVDDVGKPVADGEFGEVLIQSRYIAGGYWNAPDLTTAAFSRDRSDESLVTFRTGDLARRRADGLIEFIGRKDHQIKLHGYRIDIGEIEDARVQDAVVVVRRNDAGLPRSLVGYVEPSTGVRGLLRRDLVSMLIKRLPRYMIPATLNVVDRLPRLPTLKIDRIRMAQMDATRVVQMVNPIDDPLIAQLVKIFDSVLGNVGATAEDNVSSLGGDSLQAVKVALELEKHFGITIPSDVFESIQTIQELARWLSVQQASPTPGLGACLAQLAVSLHLFLPNRTQAATVKFIKDLKSHWCTSWKLRIPLVPLPPLWRTPQATNGPMRAMTCLRQAAST